MVYMTYVTKLMAKATLYVNTACAENGKFIRLRTVCFTDDT